MISEKYGESLKIMNDISIEEFAKKLGISELVAFNVLSWIRIPLQEALRMHERKQKKAQKDGKD